MANEAYEHHFPGAAQAESALGIPLFPSGFDVDKALSQQPGDRCDVRVKAIDLTLNALAHLLDRSPNDQTPLSEQERIQLRNYPDIRFVQDLVAVANNVYAGETRAIAMPRVEGADNPSTPRAKVQFKLTKGMFEHMQTVPNELTYSPDTPLSDQFDDTYVVIAPTATGKTVLEANLLHNVGIGKKVGAFVERVMKGMVITSSVNLGDQFVGRRGDNTFRRFLGDVGVTRFYAGSHDEGGPVVVTTGRSMNRFNPRDYTMSVIDEAHLALGPQALAYIKNIGIRCFMFTATPAYGNKADLRRHFKYIEEGTLRGFVEQGVLNPARLLTFHYDEHPEMAAAVLADRYIKAGRKVVVYCQGGTNENPGGPSKQVAELVNTLQGKHVAQDVGSHNKNSKRDVERFDQGQLRILTTSRMLREGWNADVDVAICIGPHYSMLDLQQKIGRPLRPGQFISELIELVPRHRKANRPMVSLFQLFGFEEVTSGAVVGPVDDDGGCLVSSDDPSWLFHSGNSGVGHSQKPAATRPRQDEIVDLSTLPKDILENIVVDKPVRSIIMGVNHLPTEGFVSSAKLAAGYEVPPQFVHLKLDRQGFSYEGLWLPDEHGEFRYDRWYEPAALVYLEANPIPKEAGAMELIAEEGGALCGVSKNFFLKMASLLNITPHDRLNKRRNDSKTYDLTQLVTILAAIEAIPLAAEDDEPIVDLQRELNSSFAPNSKGVYKRRNPVHGIIGWCQHVSAIEAEEMREAYYRIPVADETFVSTGAAAKAADLSLDVFRNNFTDEEKAALLPMRKQPKTPPVDHLPRAVADPLIERLKRDKLEPHLVPFSIIRQRVNRSDPVLRDWLKASDYEAVPKRITRGPSFCFPWKALEELENIYGRKPGVSAIVFKKLVQDPADFNKTRWEYTQKIQSSYLPAEGVRRMQTLQEAKEKTEQASGKAPLTPASTTYEDKQSQIAGIPVKPISERRTLSARPKSAPISPPDIPEDYVNLDEYLGERNLACEPSIARVLAHRHSLPAPIMDDDERLWASDLTAMTLEEIIMTEYELAQPGVLSPQQIANLFPGTGLTGKHVTHLVGKSDISQQGQTQICRELRVDGSAGVLRLHYDLTLTGRVRGLMSGIVRDPARLEALRRFADQI